MGILLSENPHVFPYLRPRLLPLCLAIPRNLPTSNHFPTIFTAATPAQINGENARFLLTALEQKSSKKPQLKYVSHHLASGLAFVKFELRGGGGVSVSDMWQMRNGSYMNLVVPSTE